MRQMVLGFLMHLEQNLMVIQYIIRAISAIPQDSYLITNPTAESVGVEPNYSRSIAISERNFVSDLKARLLNVDYAKAAGQHYKLFATQIIRRFFQQKITAITNTKLTY